MTTNIWQQKYDHKIFSPCLERGGGDQTLKTYTLLLNFSKIAVIELIQTKPTQSI